MPAYTLTAIKGILVVMSTTLVLSCKPHREADLGQTSALEGRSILDEAKSGDWQELQLCSASGDLSEIEDLGPEPSEDQALAALTAVQDKLTPCKVNYDGSYEIAGRADPNQIMRLGRLILTLYKRLQAGGLVRYRIVFFRGGKLISVETRALRQNASQAQVVEAVASAVNGTRSIPSAKGSFTQFINSAKFYYSDNVDLIGLNNWLKGKAFRLPLQPLPRSSSEARLYTTGSRALTASEVKITEMLFAQKGVSSAKFTVDCSGCGAVEARELADRVLRSMDGGPAIVDKLWTQGNNLQASVASDSQSIVIAVINRQTGPHFWIQKFIGKGLGL